MIVKQIISDSIPSLLPTDSGNKALNWMETFKISHLPIVLNEEYLGLISENDLLDSNNDKPVIDNKIILKDNFITEHQHIYDAINIISDNKISLLPVLDNNDKYVGSIILQDIVFAFKHISSIEDIGSTIILEIAPIDYTLTEISNIVESENIKIVSLYTAINSKTQNIDLTLRFNTNEILPVVKSFERYNYHIKAVFSNNKKSDEFYNDRLDELLFYLNI